MLKNEVLDGFVPHPLLRHHLLQTVVSTWAPTHVNWLRAVEQPFLIDAGYDHTGVEPERPVQLLAYFSPTKVMDVNKRGLALMLHGWRGCSHSPYNLVVTDALSKAGFDVVRLNLRDHGPGIHYPAHSLNKGSFFGTLIEEAEAATHYISRLAGDLPFYIVGPSLGGNFALRLALLHSENPVPNLKHVIAISPAVSPKAATKALDSEFVYRRYFREQWLNSLQAKMANYPGEYDFLAAIKRFRTVWEMTEWSIPQMTPYESAAAYFDAYSIQPDDIHRLAVATTILTAKDDPVIPAQDIMEFPDNPFLTTHVFDYGGHVGFIDLSFADLRYPIRHYLPEMILSVIGS